MRRWQPHTSIRLWTDHRGERGSSQLLLILTVATLIVVIGLVVDGGAKVQGAANAQHVAASAARAAVNSLDSELLDGGTVVVDTPRAEQAALAMLQEAGYSGTVTVTGMTVHVHVEGSVPTAFLTLIGITELPISGDAEAVLLEGDGDVAGTGIGLP